MRSCNQPGRLAGGCHMPPLFDLAPGGVCLAAAVTRSAVRSYRTLLTLLRRSESGLFSVALSLRSLLPDVIRHRSSLEPGLSSNFCSRKNQRLPGPLADQPIAGPPSYSNNKLHNIARHSPSTVPSIFSGLKRRWKATTAGLPSSMS